MAQAIARQLPHPDHQCRLPGLPVDPEQQRDAASLRQRYPGRVAFAATFSVENFFDPGWSSGTPSCIDAGAVAQGAVGVKIWKNIGMALRDARRPLRHAGRHALRARHRAGSSSDHIVLLGHQAEPLNCWLPLREDDRALGPRVLQRASAVLHVPPSRDALSRRQSLLRAIACCARTPRSRFDAVHLASPRVGRRQGRRISRALPRRARVDVAARLVHLEYQAATDRAKVRRFLIRYQDRVLYGSDDAYGPDDRTAAVADVHDGWLEDWRFLASTDHMHSRRLRRAFPGAAPAARGGRQDLPPQRGGAVSGAWPQ